MDPREIMRTVYPRAVRMCAAMWMMIPILGLVLSIERPYLSDALLSLSDDTAIVALLLGVGIVGGALSLFVTMPFLRWMGRRASDGRLDGAGNAVRVEGKVDSFMVVAFSMQGATLLACGLAELPLLIGFVLAFLSSEWLPFAIGATVTALLWAYHFPRLSRWERIYAAEEARIMGIPQIISS